MTLLSMNNKFPVYLVKITSSSGGVREFTKDSSPYTEIIWGNSYNRFIFKLRQAYLTKPNCNFNCPPGREFFCCDKCLSHCGYFEWEEIFFFSEEEREEILSFWNNGTGFLRKDGCILPRELRSYVCLSYACKHGKIKE